MKIPALLFASVRREDVLKDLKLHAETINSFRLSTANITRTKMDIVLLSFLSSFLFLCVCAFNSSLEKQNTEIKPTHIFPTEVVYLTIKFKYFFLNVILESIKVTVRKKIFILAFSKALAQCPVLLHLSRSRAKA